MAAKVVDVKFNAARRRTDAEFVGAAAHPASPAGEAPMAAARVELSQASLKPAMILEIHCRDLAGVPRLASGSQFAED